MTVLWLLSDLSIDWSLVKSNSFSASCMMILSQFQSYEYHVQQNTKCHFRNIRIAQRIYAVEGFLIPLRSKFFASSSSSALRSQLESEILISNTSLILNWNQKLCLWFIIKIKKNIRSFLHKATSHITQKTLITLLLNRLWKIRGWVNKDRSYWQTVFNWIKSNN
jgi:hypothetical protein